MKCHPDSPRLVGDPIDVITGASSDRALDFELRGPPPLRFFRHYDSRRAGEDRGMGPGHRHTLDERLLVDVDGLRHEAPDGQVREFPFLEVGQRLLVAGCLLSRTGEEEYRFSVGPGRPDRVFLARRDGTFFLARLERGPDCTTLRYGRARELLSLSAPGYRLRFTWSGVHLAQVVWMDPPDQRPRPLIAYRYDELGRLTGGTDVYGHSFALAYDDANRVVRRTDRRGYSFLFQYDERGRCVLSCGEDGALEVSLRYQPEAGLTTVKQPGGGDWYYQHDGHELTQIIDPYGAVTLAGADQELEPDSVPEHDVPATALEWEWGDLVDGQAIVLPTADDLVPGVTFQEGLLRASSAGVGGFTDVFNAHHLRVRSERADGATERFAYDPNGNLRLYVDADGRSWRWEHASRNRQVAYLDPLERAIRYEYNAAEEMTVVIDAGGTRSEYAYDLKDRPIEIRRHGKVRERMEYDDGDRLIEKRDGRGRLLLTIERDGAGRPVVRRLGSGEEQRFSWDDRGRLRSLEAESGRCEFDHDVHGRRLRDTRDGAGVVQSFDVSGLVESRVLGFATRYATVDGVLVLTDPTGREHRLEKAGHGVLIRRLAGGISAVDQYDAEGRVLARVVEWPGERPRWVRHYHYSPGGYLLQTTDSDRGGGSVFQHDAAGRLAEEHRILEGIVDRYVYDDADNLVSMPGLAEGEAVGVPGQRRIALQSGNRLWAANGERFVYDERDHLARRERPAGNVEYRHDSRDQLVAIEAPGLRWSARYDGLGRRSDKTVNGRRWTYYWSGDRLAAEVRPDGAVRLLIYADERALAPLLLVDYPALDAPAESGVVSVPFANQLGCPERITDLDGKTLWQARIAPYGSAQIEVGAGLHQPLRWPGHFFDEETGLHYNRVRYYDPTLGRYLQSDPSGIDGGYNLYAYTENPLREVDLRGLHSAGCKSAGKRHPPTEDCPDLERITRPQKGQKRPKRDSGIASLKELREARRQQDIAAKMHEDLVARHVEPNMVAVSANVITINGKDDKTDLAGPGKITRIYHDDMHNMEIHFIGLAPGFELVDEAMRDLGYSYRDHKGPDGKPIPGTALSVHGERKNEYGQQQLSDISGQKINDPMGISEQMCGDCRTWFRTNALHPDLQRRTIVADPMFTRVFQTDGSVDVYDAHNKYVGTVEPDTDAKAGVSRGYKFVAW
jgi:RHS repeat-associated protein